MTVGTGISHEELVDRLALRELVDTFARHADSRAIDDLTGLFTPDGQTLVFMDSRSPDPTRIVSGRAEHAEMFAAALAAFTITTHFNGQSTVAVDGDSATAETHCLAHHVLEAGGALMTMGIRYQDTFARQDGGWRFRERRVLVDWTDTRA